jgi:hypothetical protein
MRSALSRYSPGGGGGAGGAGGDGAGFGGDAGGAVNPVINISTGDTLTFEGKNYVSRDDFQAGLYQAAQSGAKQGEARTLRKLQNSPGARRRLGMA